MIWQGSSGDLVSLRGLDDALGIAALLQGEPAGLLRVWVGCAGLLIRQSGE